MSPRLNARGAVSAKAAVRETAAWLAAFTSPRGLGLSECSASGHHGFVQDDPA